MCCVCHSKSQFLYINFNLVYHCNMASSRFLQRGGGGSSGGGSSGGSSSGGSSSGGIRSSSTGGGTAVYVGPQPPGVIAVIVLTTVGIPLLAILVWWCWRKRGGSCQRDNDLSLARQSVRVRARHEHGECRCENN